MTTITLMISILAFKVDGNDENYRALLLTTT